MCCRGRQRHIKSQFQLKTWIKNMFTIEKQQGVRVYRPRLRVRTCLLALTSDTKKSQKKIGALKSKYGRCYATKPVDLY